MTLYRQDNLKAGVKPLTGVERCPKCGALQDLKDKFVTIKFEDKTVQCWSCHACGNAFRTCEGQILDVNQWPIRRKEGSHRVELKEK